MQHNELFKILKSFSTPQLVALYGEESVNAIAGIMGDAITESRLTDLLFNKFGTQILSNRDIRNAVFTKLPHSDLVYVLEGDRGNGRSLTIKDAERLYGLRWGRTLATSKRLLEVLELDESFLPPVNSQKPDVETVDPRVKLYPHQLRLKDQLVRTLGQTRMDRILVHMPTGAGKTRTSIEGVIEYWKSIADRKKHIVWIAHSEELCEQAVETFQSLWSARGDSAIQINRLWGSHQLGDCSNEQGRVIIAGFQKLYSMIRSNSNETFEIISSLKRNAAVVIVDEAHKSVAPTYQTCIEFLLEPRKTKLIGLTATPGRGTDDVFESSGTETHQLAEFFDWNKLGLVDEAGLELDDPIGYLQENQFLARIVRKRVTTNISLELSEAEQDFVSKFLELPTSVLRKLAVSDERNAIILSEIAALRLQQKQIIVFAISVEHSRLINELLNLKGISSKAIDGETESSERANSIDEFKRGDLAVLVNYGVLTTGFDAPNTNAVVITRPTASIVLYSQMIGRGIRGPKVGGNHTCHLVDLEDNLIGFPSEQQAFNHFNTAWT